MNIQHIYVFAWQFTDEATYSATESTPFQTEDLDKTLFEIHEALSLGLDLEIFGITGFKLSDFEKISQSIFTLEDWISQKQVPPFK